MGEIDYQFMIDGEEWKPCHLDRLAYERNLHILHQMKQHGLEIRDGEKILSDDDIDYLTADQVWKVSQDARARYTGKDLLDAYKDSFERSDKMWKELDFGQDKPMKVSRCHLNVHGIPLQEYMQFMRKMQEDENILLGAHPEHFQTAVTDTDIIGIEPFGMYGTPTLVHVAICQEDELGDQIRQDRKADYPIVTTGRAYLTDDTTEINTPFHQLKPTEDGFEVELAVYWPAGVPDELVDGHSLHLAMEFYESLKSLRDSHEHQDQN